MTISQPLALATVAQAHGTATVGSGKVNSQRGIWFSMASHSTIVANCFRVSSAASESPQLLQSLLSCFRVSSAASESPQLLQSLLSCFRVSSAASESPQLLQSLLSCLGAAKRLFQEFLFSTWHCLHLLCICPTITCNTGINL